MVKPAKTETWNPELLGKVSKDGIEDITKNTALRVTDFDQKALQLFDVLEKRDKATEACQFLKQALEGHPRERVSNWKAYVYTLLRGFDEAAYKAMKSSDGRRRPRGDRARDDKAEKSSRGKDPVRPFSFNPGATEFVPGQLWSCPKPVGEAAAVAPAVGETVEGAPAAAPDSVEEANGGAGVADKDVCVSGEAPIKESCDAAMTDGAASEGEGGGAAMTGQPAESSTGTEAPAVTPTPAPEAN